MSHPEPGYLRSKRFWSILVHSLFVCQLIFPQSPFSLRPSSLCHSDISLADELKFRPSYEIKSYDSQLLHNSLIFSYESLNFDS